MWRIILTVAGLVLGYVSAMYTFAGVWWIRGIDSAGDAFAIGLISYFLAGPVGAIVGGILGFRWGDRRDKTRQIREWDEIARLDDESSK